MGQLFFWNGLIDEPEIHLHPRWQRLLVRALTDLCAEHSAQLIITTHSEEVANAVYEHELVLLDAILDSRARDQLIEAGQHHVPAELQELAQCWTR